MNDPECQEPAQPTTMRLAFLTLVTSSWAGTTYLKFLTWLHPSMGPEEWANLSRRFLTNSDEREF